MSVHLFNAIFLLKSERFFYTERLVSGFDFPGFLVCNVLKHSILKRNCLIFKDVFSPT